MRKFKPYRLPPKRNILIQQGTSNEELELYNTVRLLDPSLIVYRGDRAVLHGREIDIWIPSHKLGVEYDGLFFHNTSKRDDPTYHLYKTIECEKQGIRLIHVFSDDWTTKRPLVVDLISKVLGRYYTIDNYYIAEITRNEGKQFLDNAHLRGNDNVAKKYIGFIYNSEIIAAASLRERDKDYEITRFAERRGIKARDALKNLTEYLQDKYHCDIYVSLDRSLYDGNDFKAIGYKEVDATEPSFFYTKDYKTRLSEAIEGAVKVYDCGKKILLKKLQN